ncbi:hypothetical protein D1872_308150 [compost metagenome]
MVNDNVISGGSVSGYIWFKACALSAVTVAHPKPDVLHQHIMRSDLHTSLDECNARGGSRLTCDGHVGFS